MMGGDIYTIFANKIAATFFRDGQDLRANVAYGQWTASRNVEHEDRLVFNQDDLDRTVGIIREELADKMRSAANALEALSPPGKVADALADDYAPF